jgi:deoxyribodipyrimidine photo-lyase
LSNMSPWYHYGQVSVQRCILDIQSYKPQFTKAVEAYTEEAIVRRELADNFCYYQKNYDNIKGCYDWASKTLNDHAGDKRQFVYSKEQFEKACTHDRLWNAAQIQVIKEGKMHGFLRM